MSKIALIAMVAAVSVGASVSPSTAGSPVSLQTRDFVRAAAQSDHFEILEAQAASAQSASPRVRAFAARMIQDHTDATEMLHRAMERAGMTAPPPGLSGDQQKMLSTVQSLRGAALDREYAKQQVLAHHEALVVEGAYADHGDAAPIRRAAQSMVRVVQHHAQMAQQLRAELSGS